MRIKLCSLILALLLIRLSDLYGQSQIDNYSKYNLGIDFLRFNRNWIYFPERLNSMDGKNYHPYFTPSVFFKINEGNHSLRFKYEYLRCKYWLVTGGQSDLYEELKGSRYINKFSLPRQIFFPIKFSTATHNPANFLCLL
jgi:hypothetical protein